MAFIYASPPPKSLRSKRLVCPWMWHLTLVNNLYMWSKFPSLFTISITNIRLMFLLKTGDTCTQAPMALIQVSPLHNIYISSKISYLAFAQYLFIQENHTCRISLFFYPNLTYHMTYWYLSFVNLQVWFIDNIGMEPFFTERVMIILYHSSVIIFSSSYLLQSFTFLLI